MVGFITKPAIEEEEQLNRAPTAKISIDSYAITDQIISDISLADAFLDFDSIKAWFEHFPDDSGIVQQPRELSMAEAKKVSPLSDEVCVKSELISFGETEGASAPGGVGESKKDAPVSLVKGELVSYGETEGASAPGGVDDSKTGAPVSLVKREVLSDAEDEGKSNVSSIDFKKSEDVVVNDGKEGRDMSDGDSGSESSSEAESSDSSSSSSSSSSSHDDDDDDEEEEDEAGEMEEGEIREVNKEKMSIKSDKEDDDEGEDEMDSGELVDDMVSWSDVEEGDAAGGGGGPIRSKNEVQVLPPVPHVEAKLEPNHQMLPVGVVLSVLGAQVIVEGVEKHAPLNEGSILWITERRAPLGIVDEIFGPVKNPYYMVRYNSEDEVPSGISQGALVSFVPEFASHILNEKNLYKKGYDASGDNDEELSDEAEFSDDEKEAEYRRMQRMAKRGATDPSDPKGVNKKNFGKKGRERDARWKKNSSNPSIPQTPPSSNPQYQNNTISAASSSVPPGFGGGSGVISPFPPPQQPGNSVQFTPSGVWVNGNFLSQQQIGAVLANGLVNGMQLPQVNPFPYQMPVQNPLLVPNMVLPNMGQPNALGGPPPFAQWPQNAGVNQAFGMGFNQIPSFNGGSQGIQPGGLQIEPSAAPPGFSGAPGIFNPGSPSSRGRKPPSNRRGGGRFSGNGGRQQFK